MHALRLDDLVACHPPPGRTAGEEGAQGAEGAQPLTGGDAAGEGAPAQRSNHTEGESAH